MMRFAVRRALHAVAVLALISFFSFALLQLAPGDYVDEMRLDVSISASTASAWRARYGLDEPLPVRYVRWLGSVLRGEFGISFAYGMPVGSLLWPRMKNTLWLACTAAMASWFAAIILGGAAAARPNRALDRLVRGGTSLLSATPDLLVALALITFAVRTGWWPVSGIADVQGSESASARTGEAAAHLALPALALILVTLPVLVRHVQSSVRDSLDSPFIQAARAHGIPRRRVWALYVLPAAANPLISLFGYSIGGLLSSSLLVEVVTGWPGLGPLLLESIFSRDVYVVIGATLISALFLIAGNFAADLLLYAVDPRIRVEKS